MAVHIRNLDIMSFRRIQGMHIDNLRDVNIIAGDNNTGKTSILEAISLLRTPFDIYNVLKVARMREIPAWYSASVYDSFISLFPKNNTHIGLLVEGNIGSLEMHLAGEEEHIIIDAKSIQERFRYSKENIVDTEAIGFNGILEGRINAETFSQKVELNQFSTGYGLFSSHRRQPDYMNIVYLSPMAHLKGNVFNKIIKSPSYKEVCIRVLNLFDEDIIDLVYLKNESTSRAVECVEHRKLGIMPLATYGDGIKKVISLANAIASAKDGILLIDEIETSINYKYYDEIFNFIIKACATFNVQVFITTHNSEAIDGLLSTQNYNDNENYDRISVLTFRENGTTKKIDARILSGKETFLNRERFDFEVRL